MLSAFGLHGPSRPLAGGQGTSWRADAAVLKPLDTDPALLPWYLATFGDLDPSAGFRVSMPLAARDGSFLVEGWTAWRYEPGRHVPRAWREIIAAGTRLHEWLEGIPAPPWLHSRTDPWAVADRVAWGEATAPYDDGRPLAAMIAALRPVDGRRRLVHGDLTGNVLFDDRLPPLVIDLSLYWRPPLFASAVVVADALVFEGAPQDLVRVLGAEPEAAQYLLRALIYRAVADRLLRPDTAQAGADDPFRDAADLAVHLARTANRGAVPPN